MTLSLWAKVDSVLNIERIDRSEYVQRLVIDDLRARGILEEGVGPEVFAVVREAAAQGVSVVDVLSEKIAQMADKGGEAA